MGNGNFGCTVGRTMGKLEEARTPGKAQREKRQKLFVFGQSHARCAVITVANLEKCLGMKQYW